MSKWDVIVIGAGNGGLASAVTFANEGKKVLILEKHNVPGGYATSFRRGRFPDSRWTRQILTSNLL